MQQQKILKGIMVEILQKIEVAMVRSSLAYSYYLEEKKYYQALRIFKANKVLYNLLELYLNSVSKENIGVVLNFIFHLEDWFEQFKECEKIEVKDLTLDSVFIFIRKENSPPFPKDFINDILNKNL